MWIKEYVKMKLGRLIRIFVFAESAKYDYGGNVYGILFISRYKTSYTA